ncbi:MAG: IPT/TIG domain-containing protein [Gemmatimonadetes bacterium]|nr:IPT/TIG domain-containing protein [Gemmatimonadota bacterium]
MAAVLALSAAAACNDATPPLVPTTLALSTSSVTLDALGATEQVTIEVRDQNGKAMPSVTPTVTSSAPTVATVSGGSSATITAVGNGTATLTIAAARATSSIAVTVTQVPTSIAVASGNNQTGRVGSVLPTALAARVADRLERPVAGTTVSFSAAIGSGSVAGTQAATDAQGIATASWTLGTTPGVKSVAAFVSGLPIAAFNATATVGPAAALSASAGNNQVSGLSATLPVPPAVKVADAFGNGVAGVAVTFSVASGGGSATGTAAVSNDAGIATVGSWIMGPASGVNTLTATAVGLSTVTFTATAGIQPMITAVGPSPLVPGSAMTVTGANFAPTIGGNTLRVGGATAVITAASPIQLTATVPCVAGGTIPVTVTAGEMTSSAVSAVLTTTVRSLAVGEAFVASTNAESRCNELPAAGGSARYLVSVFSTSTSANTLVDFELGGNAPAAAAARTVASLRARPDRFAPDEAQARADRAHWEHLERERALGDELRARHAAAGSPARTSGAAVLADPPVVGERRVFYWNYGSCSDTSRTVTARVLYAGSRAIIWEDTSNAVLAVANPTLADRYQRLGQVFDLDQYDVVRATFGDPLRRDAATDNDGRVHMVFTRRVNEIGGVAAFVTSTDQYPRTTCAASNVGEFFYGSVPTQSGSNLESSAAPDGWFNFMGRTVIHEVKHVASLAARVANGVSFEQSWLEEGTARHAEEVWARQALHRAPWKGNHGYGTAASNGLFCDFNSSNATCLANDPLRRPSWGVRRPFNELRSRLLEPWNWSPFGDGTGQSGSVFYQTAWSLVRYAIDLYGASDADFLGALTNSTTNGTTNLANTAGVPFATLLGGWTLALYADDYPGLVGASNTLKYQTWNLRNIYASLNADPLWTSRFPTPFPIAPTALSVGAFTAQQIGVRGGGNAYFEISGSAATAQVLNLRAVGGGAPSTLLRIAIARLQ